MDSQKTVLAQPMVSILGTTLVALFLWVVFPALSNIYFHSLSKFPGPKIGAATEYYKAYIELIQGRSWHHHLEKLHAQFGPVVRVGPNELHFSQPEAYHDIYNNSNRWDKEPNLYHSFGEDESSFGYLTWKEAKPRKDVLGRSFSLQAINQAQGLVQDKVDALCKAFTKAASKNMSVHLSWAYRCMTMDIITYYCFGKAINAIDEPGFKAPIIVAMDAALPVFVAFKHSSLINNLITRSPRPISRLTSPQTAGLVDLQEILETQISELAAAPEKLDLLPHRMTIYHSLMSPESHKSGTVPSARSLYDEAQALMFAGADTVGNTLMLGTFYMLRKPQIASKLKTELLAVFPETDKVPSIATLEKLPYLNACIKESLRMASGVISGLPRIVPESGAKIAGHDIPGGAIVSIGSTFVHYNAKIFPDPDSFQPERWLSTDATANPNQQHQAKEALETWLVPFSRGPRSCLGINLAWLELRLAMACVFRRFDLKLDESITTTTTTTNNNKQLGDKLRFKDAFLPVFIDGPVMVKIKVFS